MVLLPAEGTTTLPIRQVSQTEAARFPHPFPFVLLSSRGTSSSYDSESGFRTSVIDLLRCGIGRGSEYRGTRDLISVAVGSDHGRCTIPGGGALRVCGLGTESCNPWRRVSDRGVKNYIDSLLDEVTPFIERLPHVVSNHAHRFGYKTGNQPRCPASTPRSGRTSGSCSESVPEYCGDVVCVAETSCADDTREQVCYVVMVGLGSAQLSGERAECIRIDDFVSLFCIETGCSHQRCPPVTLRRCCDRFVLGSKLGNRSPGFLLDCDRFMRGKLRSDVLQHPGENAAAGGFIVLTRMWTIMGSVGLIDGDIGDVGVTAPSHRHVEILPSHC